MKAWHGILSLTVLIAFPAWASNNQATEGITHMLAHADDCPPFCMTPMRFHPDVMVVGELELTDLRKKETVVLIDVRERDEAQASGSIPGAILLPYHDVGLEFGADPIRQAAATRWLRSQFRMIVFDDGPHDYRAIRILLELLKEGMPGEKLLWYRGGILHWRQAALPTAQAKDFYRLRHSE